jgi:hypothetical protein
MKVAAAPCALLALGREDAANKQAAASVFQYKRAELSVSTDFSISINCLVAVLR